MKQPSKNFNEIVPPGEDEKFADYAVKLRTLQKVKSKEYGNGRLLHRKQTLAIRGELMVDKKLPEYAAQGIFAKPGKYPVIIRLSNGGLDVKADKAPDIRGFAFKVQKVSGRSALDGKSTSVQDFLLINHTTFSAARAEEFLDLLLALAKGGGAVLKHLMKAHGFFGMFAAMARFAKVIGKKFTSYLSENFSTVLPVKNGDYAMKLRIRPLSPQLGEPNKADITADVRKVLKSTPAEYAVELQFYTDADLTPIENASIEWPESESPWVRVGTLTLPVQDLEGAEYEKFAATVEKMKFDPWNAIEEHQPLGNIMRARKHAYYVSQKERGAA